MFPQPSTFPSDLVECLDKQLNHLNAIVHVTVDNSGNLVLVAIGQSWPAPLPLRHPTLSSFVEAETLAARLNTLQGASDRDRISALRSMVNARRT
ncbi:hypothetical protein [Pseudomonas sp. BN102]|uniref:hypothetical protein n=1 Tax=Pseudomonas sp. BN102 TaxID=2567886 RepID=UPI002457BC05|nr:hypothetical protein [Pseudomonas sp. BN102]MDH4610315.1 hypothetical protein [Pseudomonas sp. BN102]